MFDGNLFDAQVFEAPQVQEETRRSTARPWRRPRYWWEIEREELKELRERS